MVEAYLIFMTAVLLYYFNNTASLHLLLLRILRQSATSK